MKGKLFKIKENDIWMVRFPKPGFTEEPIPNKELPLYLKNLNESQTQSLNIDMEVNFEIIDEFTHPDLYEDVGLFDGTPMAKLNLK